MSRINNIIELRAKKLRVAWNYKIRPIVACYDELMQYDDFLVSTERYNIIALFIQLQALNRNRWGFYCILRIYIPKNIHELHSLRANLSKNNKQYKKAIKGLSLLVSKKLIEQEIINKN